MISLTDARISDVSGSKYSNIEIPSIYFFGLIDWSPRKRFGLAHGSTYDGSKSIMFFVDGVCRWKHSGTNIFDIHLTDEGVGMWVSDEVVVFTKEGILFKTPWQGTMGKIQRLEATPEGLKIHGERLIFTYDMSGRLLSSVTDQAKLLSGEGPKYLRWDRFREAENCINQGNKDKAKTLFLICSKEFDDNPTQQSLIYRQLGEIELEQGNKKEAVKFWQKAMAINPKVGIKKKLADLMKDLG